MEKLTVGLNALMTANGLSPKEKTLLQRFIEETARKAKGFISELFSFDITRTVKAQPEEFIITKESIEKDFYAPIRTREHETGNVAPWLDEDIWKFWKGKKVAGFAMDIVFSIYRFLQTLTHQQILNEGEAQDIKKVYSYTEAKEIIRTGIFAGDVDTKGTGILVYFKADEKGPLFRFRAFRYDDGQLRVHVDEVYLENEWDAGYGVCFGN